ncbi:MAG TPA: quinoprotein dehydrogenase-associated SoxYZ-like carrier [Stellaceae bacterium]|nr:quinoprotein dehydrogenase-associated SoxYZ-like carrier [Stellaceae bacterium]
MPRTSWALSAVCLALSGMAMPAAAEVDEATRAQRWADLRAQIFGDRAIAEAGDRIAIEAPDRAEDAALVPVTIRINGALRGQVKQIYFVIDDNPSPLAGRFTFGPAADPNEIATRVRVDDYTYLHAVAETRDGRLYGAQRFIKAAGGCSAPATKDQVLAEQRLGQLKMSLRAPAHPGEPTEAHLLVSHPNSSGMQMDQLTRNFIPANFVRAVSVTYNGSEVLRVESDISISEDPSFTFDFLPTAASADLKVEVEDSNNRHFQGSWPVKPKPGT